MVLLYVADQGQVDGMRPKLAHHLRCNISAANAFIGQIFKLGTGLTQRGSRHDGVSLFRCGTLVSPLRREQVHFQVTI